MLRDLLFIFVLLFQSYADRESNDEDNYPEVEKVMMKILKLHQDLHERWYLNKTFISRNRQEIRSRFRNRQEIRSPMFSVILYDDESRLHWRYDESRLKKTSTRGNRTDDIKDCHEQKVKNGNGIEIECGISIIFTLCLITSQSADSDIFTISVSIFFEKSNSRIY